MLQSVSYVSDCLCVWLPCYAACICDPFIHHIKSRCVPQPDYAGVQLAMCGVWCVQHMSWVICTLWRWWWYVQVPWFPICRKELDDCVEDIGASSGGLVDPDHPGDSVVSYCGSYSLVAVAVWCGGCCCVVWWVLLTRSWPHSCLVSRVPSLDYSICQSGSWPHFGSPTVQCLSHSAIPPTLAVWWVCYCAACWVLLCCEYSLLGGCSGFNDEEYVKRRGEIAKTPLLSHPCCHTLAGTPLLSHPCWCTMPAECCVVHNASHSWLTYKQSVRQAVALKSE
jgi:hypothetical protein